MARVVISREELGDLRDMLANRGGRYSSETLYRWHVQWAEREGREPVTPLRLGQILREYGAERRKIWDRSKPGASTPTASGGRRKGEMVNGWEIFSGLVPPDPDELNVAAVARDMGMGIYLPKEIYARYLKLARDREWEAPLSEKHFSRLLTKMGYSFLPGDGRNRGKRCRFFEPRDS